MNTNTNQTFSKGEYAKFKGYAVETEDKKLEDGALVQVTGIKDKGDEGVAYDVYAVDEKGVVIPNREGEEVFPEELDKTDPPVKAAGRTRTPAKTAEATPAPAKTTAPAKVPAKAAKTVDPKQAAKDAKAKEKAAADKAKAKAAADKEKAKTKAAAEKEKAKAKAAKEKERAKAKAEREAARAAKAAAAQPKEDAMMREVAPMASVSVILSEKSALDAAAELVNRAEETDFTLGGVLQNIYMTGAYKQLGPNFDGKDGFALYCDTVLSIGSRKAAYLMKTYIKFAVVLAALGKTHNEAEFATIGWSKVKELARISEEELTRDFDKLLGLARNKTRDELVSYIKTTYEVVTRGEQVQRTTFKFSLLAEEGATATRALEMAKGLIGENDDAKAFAYITGDWLNNQDGAETTLDQLKQLALARFGVTLVEGSADGEESQQEGEAATAAS